MDSQGILSLREHAQLDQLDIQTQYNQVPITSKEDAAVHLILIISLCSKIYKERGRPLTTRFSANAAGRQACSDFLRERNDICKLLAEAHAKKQYEAIRNLNELVDATPPVESPQAGFFKFADLPKHPEALLALNKLMFTYVIKGELIHLGMEHSVLLHLEFGRYGTVGGKTVVRVDEPLPLVATHAWFLRKKGFTAYATATNKIQRPLLRSDGYQEYLALLLCQAFRKSIPLQYLFKFHGETPAWVEEESAEIIALRVDGDQKTVRPVDPSSKVLGVQAGDAKDTLKWLANPDGVPFCFPDDEMGPEIVFLLRLSNQRLVWVLVRVISIREVSTTKSVSPSMLFKTNPEAMADVNRILASTPQLKIGQASGDIKIIRVVVSFSKSAAASESLQEAVAEEASNAEDKRYPLASLNMDKCMMVQDAQKATEAFMKKFQADPSMT